MPTAFPARTVAIAAVLLALAPACAESPTRPAIADIRLSVSTLPAVGQPGQPISIEIRVVNSGKREAWHCDGCGCGNGTSLEVLGPDGTRVELNDPRALLPACPEGVAPLEPGAVLGSTGPFTGVLYVRDSSAVPSPTYAAPPGTYTVVAGFAYSLTRGGEAFRIERRATFVWNP